MLYNIHNLSLVDGDKTILSEITFDIDAGSYTTITGPSGSGKSTLLKILATLQAFTSGDIFYDGKDLTQLDPISYRREASYCFQQPQLFGETVKDNLAFPFVLRKEPFDVVQAESALAQVNLGADFLSQSITKLSGGEKQRVALVRNMLRNPKVLLLDEVTTGLDVDNKQIVRTFIEQAHTKGTTIIEVTHDTEELNHAETIITINGGRLK